MDKETSFVPNQEKDLQDKGLTQIENESGTYYCLSIIGQIEGHYALEPNQKATKYDHIIPLLAN